MLTFIPSDFLRISNCDLSSISNESNSFMLRNEFVVQLMNESEVTRKSIETLKTKKEESFF